jgi:hypothetical protein
MQLQLLPKTIKLALRGEMAYRCVCVVLHVAVFIGTSATRPVSPHTSSPRRWEDGRMCIHALLHERKSVRRAPMLRFQEGSCMCTWRFEDVCVKLLACVAASIGTATA